MMRKSPFHARRYRTSRWLLPACALLVSTGIGSSHVALADTSKAAPAWEQFDQEDGITVYRRDIPGSPVVALRGEGIVNASIARVTSVLIDQRRSSEWIDSLAANRIVRKISDTEFVLWDHIKTPIVLKDRDFVFVTKLTTEPKAKKVRLDYRSVTDPAAPPGDFVRGEFLYGKFELTALPGGKTRVLAEVLADPKGSVPKWIVNLFQKGWPHNTISSLRAQVAKPDVVDDPRIVARLKAEGFFQ